MELIKYILMSTVCLSICFLFYKLAFRAKDKLKQLRFFLLLTAFLSILIPLSNYKIDFVLPNGNQILDASNIQAKEQIVAEYNNNQTLVDASAKIRRLPSISFGVFVKYAYFLISLILVTRLLIQLILLGYQSIISEKFYQGKYVYVYNKRFENIFSFFNWIFVHKDLKGNKEIDGILMHEKIHASQYHSVDIIAIELLAAVMWFNPIVWMMRKEIQLVHEYLADEGALSTGIDRLEYQALLINQVTEERLICLSSSFNHSLIKKRMIMMTKQKFNQRTKLKFLTLIPLAAILFIGVACVNGQNKSNSVTAVAPVKMNVLYIGVDNPIIVAASGYDASELEVEVDNGRISGSNGEYVLNPGKSGTAVVTVKVKGEIIQESQFRVKTVPAPVAKIGGKSGGEIAKSELLAQSGVEVVMENFEFDLLFEIVEFTVSTTIAGYLKEQTSKSYKITKEQKELIKKMERGQRLYIQDIKCKGPDGATRNLPAIALLLN